MNADQTKELAHDIYQNLVALQIELAALRSVLQGSVIRDQNGNVLDWKKTVDSHREQINSIRGEALYSDIEQEFLLAATSEAAPALRQLLRLLNHPALNE
jgi:hypothetical protein